MVGLTLGLVLTSRVIYFPVDARPKTDTTIELESHYENSNRWGLELSDEDIDLLYRICVHEANNQSDAGVQAVAEVVLNRISSSSFPNTVAKVLFAPGQFCSEQELRNTPTNSRVEEIVNKLIWGESEYILSTHAMYFQNYPTGHKDEVQIGDHYFRRRY